MNITNCNDIFTLLHTLLPNLKDGSFGELRAPDLHRAKLAAIRIADAAHKRLAAGPTGADVERAWTQQPPRGPRQRPRKGVDAEAWGDEPRS